MRVGHGFDVHPLVEGRKLVLGGVHVAFERGALGHSDADVLAHALADALLGAAGLSDLGTRFPASDPRWKDADSMELLAQCAAAVRAAGFEIVNTDATIVVDRPQARAAHRLDASEPRGSAGDRPKPHQREGQIERGLGLYGRRNRHRRLRSGPDRLAPLVTLSAPVSP